MSYRNWVEMNPETVKKLGLSDGALVKVTTPGGEIEAPVFTYPAIRPDTIAIPVGYGHSDLGRFAQGHGSNAIQLVGAQGTSDNSNLAWNTLRAKVTPTGQNIYLPLFGDQEGTTSGFINKGNPAL
jgi:anaerobic selenocysteine-containing dehydrogenase